MYECSFTNLVVVGSNPVAVSYFLVNTVNIQVSNKNVHLALWHDLTERLDKASYYMPVPTLYAYAIPPFDCDNSIPCMAVW